MNTNKIRATLAFFSVVFLVIILSIACVSTPPQYTAPIVRVIEKEMIFKKSFNSVWEKTVEWFATHNMPIKHIDKNSGFISTEYSLTNPTLFMDCGQGEPSSGGEIRIGNHSGNFNILVKKMNDYSTKVTINSFFSAISHYYGYRCLNCPLELLSSGKINCVSSGELEKQIFNFISSK